MANRLARSTSPYLLQHAENPVDWWEWSPEAFAEARRRDVPILLSVGYAACHWCHVMAHESFEDETVAHALRDGFVAVKVDREERPDVDAAYMSATTALTGQGGWPMTCLLTPEGQPFWAGTYLPRTQFLALLDAASRAWRTQRDDVAATGARVTEALRTAAAPPDHPLDAVVLDHAVEVLRSGFDEARGGFGRAPKFPPSMVLEFLLRHHARDGAARTADALAMVTRTCEAMARGGLYDQVGGGFARYSVDADWVVPHFEKMLYDNAQLLAVYVHWWRATGAHLGERVARETADFLLQELRTPEGAFASSLDADTVVDGVGVEGATYVWTPDELRQVLGEEDGRWAAEVLTVTEGGTFERGASTLQLREEPDGPRWAEARRRLRAARALRPQPARDDKVVAAWNGLAISALAEAGALLGEPTWVEAAAQCARTVLDTHLVDERLRRVSRDGVVGSAAGVADDHGNLAAGLLTLHQVTGDPTWLAHAGQVLEIVLTRFAEASGGVRDTADDAEELFTRPHTQGDNAEPSGTSAVAGALLTYAALTGSRRHREAAEQALAGLGGLARREPRFAGWALAVAEAAVEGPLQVAVVGDDAIAEQLTRTARLACSPGLVLVQGEPDAAGVPLLADRPRPGGRSAAYVCRGFVCDAPVTDVAALRAALGRP